MDAVYSCGVCRTDVFVSWRGTSAVDKRRACYRRAPAGSENSEQDQGSATIFSAHRFILLADCHQAVQTDNSICARTLTTATIESVQVADGSSKVISGQEFKSRIQESEVRSQKGGARK